ncbi:MAG: RNA pseudouridine synthase [Treponema sp.]|jgi:23S rRNA pseudouridine1911/1915/1917 synthase|nr:RNA pseudouridine synthase [Treponema sp.]
MIITLTEEAEAGLAAEPRVIAVSPDFAAVYKPPRMHCAPAAPGRPCRGTLLEWCGALFPETLAVSGRGRGEGGLLHRLDYEARGLVLFARHEAAFAALAAQQEAGAFVKEYTARSAGVRAPLPAGFPPLPEGLASAPLPPSRSRGALHIASAFRPYGPGRKAVRPLPAPARNAALDQGLPYVTEMLEAVPEALPEAAPKAGGYRFTVRLRRGFRHQVRCHLAWIGFPLAGDTLYGGAPADFLALCARRLEFAL